MLAVEKEIDIWEVGWWPSVYDHFIQYQEASRSFRGFTSCFIFTKNYAAQSTAQSKRSMTFQYIGDLLFEVIKLKGRQKTQTSQMEGHNRGDRLLW